MQHGLLLNLLIALLTLAPTVPVHAHGPSPGEGESRPPAVATQDAAPEGYALSAAYPNPFHTRTTFDLRVDKTQHVSVEVYNILGQRVRTLFEGVVQDGEAHTFAFEAKGLPSGLYLYRIIGETFRAARRVTLVR